MPHWFKTTVRMAAIVGGASFAAILVLLFTRQFITANDVRSSNDSVGNYLQTVGGIYAVLLAFIVYVVWNQFNDSRSLVDREATALVDLHRTASGLPAATRREIQQALQHYVEEVLQKEWRAMAKHDEATIEKVGLHLEHVWSAIHACQPRNECQHAIYGEVLSRFNDLSDLRTNRLSSSRARIPLLMRLLLYLGAMIVVGSVYIMAFDKLWLHAAVAGALSGAVAHILYLIYDLDNAFAGQLQISKAPFERARRAFDRETHKVDAAA